MSFAMEKEIAGNNPRVAHFINLVLFILCGLVLYKFFRLLLPRFPWVMLLCVTILFLALPVHTEVVSSVKSRDELMAFFFGFTALTLLLRPDARRTMLNRIAAGTFFLIALLSKENALMLLPVFFLALIMLMGRSLKASLTACLPLITVGVFWLILRFIIVHGPVDQEKLVVSNNVLYGAGGFSEQFGTRMEILLLYLRLLVIPFPLSWDYSYNQVPLVTWYNYLSLTSLVIHLSLLTVMVYNFRKRPLLSFGIAFYFISSLMTNNLLFPIGSTAAVRFLFMPSVAFALLLLVLPVAWFHPEKNIPGHSQNKWIRYCFLPVLACYMVLTFYQSKAWASNRALFEAGLKAAPNSVRTMTAMASEYRMQAERSPDPLVRDRCFRDAMRLYRESLRLLPSFSDASYNLGVTYTAMTDTVAALEMYRQTIRFQPRHHFANLNCGLLYAMQSRRDSAIKYLKRVIQFYPDDSKAPSALAVVYFQRQEYPAALAYARAAQEISPEDAINNNNLSSILKAMEMGSQATAAGDDPPGIAR